MGVKNAASGALSGAGAGAAFGPWGAAIGGVAGGAMGALSPDSPDYAAIFGDLDPATVEELIAAGELDGTAYDAIKEDPATRAAQMEALNSLIGTGRAQGMDLGAQVAHEQATQRNAQADYANRMAALNTMAMRGQLNGGAALAAQLAGQQQTSQANATAGAQAAADARTRALQAMIGAGSLGGQVRGQDYQRESDKAAARDAIARFNANNRVNAYQTSFNQRLAKANGQAGMAPQAVQQSNAQAAAAGRLGGQAYDSYQQSEDERRRENGGSPYLSAPSMI